MRKWIPLAFVIANLALEGCGSSPLTHFYTIDEIAPTASPTAWAGRRIKIATVHVPPVLNRPEIVTQDVAGQIEWDDFAKWASPLDELVRQTLTQDLAKRLPLTAVVYPNTALPAEAREVLVDILSVSTKAGTTRMDVSCSDLVGLNGRAPRTAVVYELSVPSAGDGSQAFANDMSRLIGLLSDRIAASISSAEPMTMK